MWDLSCVDWADRIREGRSLIPDLPLIESEARDGLAFFDEMQLSQVPGTPRPGTPNHPLQPRLRIIAAHAIIEDRDAEPRRLVAIFR